RLVGQLTARRGGELAVLGEYERARDAKGEEIGGLLALAGLVGHRPFSAGAEARAPQFGGQRGGTDLPPVTGDREADVPGRVGHPGVLGRRAPGEAKPQQKRAAPGQAGRDAMGPARHAATSTRGPTFPRGTLWPCGNRPPTLFIWL